jgi:hypothetical protein
MAAVVMRVEWLDGSRMQTWWAENLNLLWERDPTLAGRVRLHPAVHSIPDADAALPGDLSGDDAGWAEAQLPLLRGDRLGVVFGLGPHVWALRARVTVPLWVVEPSVSALIACMAHLPLQPLLLSGRLLVGEPPEAVVAALCRQRLLTLLRHPGRYLAEPDYFSGIDQRLQARAEAVGRMRALNSHDRLREKAGDSELGALLSALPPAGCVSVEAIDAFIGRTHRPWGRAERLIVAMNSFK